MDNTISSQGISVHAGFPNPATDKSLQTLDPQATDCVVWWNEDQISFAVSHFKDLPNQATLWGVVTATIHQFRKKNV
ncbi:MAG TPA: hypothetical protein VMY99_05260 [Nevskiaceae bacterium]|nr:hypothetical protein [Nevskiaceae bacterium]